jgi:hypothetical protein
MHKPEDQGYKVTTNCELDADTRESLLQHLDVHGVMSLLTSSKFSTHVNCLLSEIEQAIAGERESVIQDASEPDTTAPKADEATELPAAMRVRVQTGRRITRYRQGRG